MHYAQRGDRVRIEYFRIHKQGAARDKQLNPKTREFTVGSSEVPPTLSSGVVGMIPGDRIQLTLQPGEAYGTVKPKLFRQIPRERFPENLVLRVNQRLTSVNAISGRRRRVRVVQVQPHSVLVNGNHPLAGKAIELEIMLVSLDSSSYANQTNPQFDLGGESGEN